MDIADVRRQYPATSGRAYLNTASTGLASARLARTYHAFVDEWAAEGLDFRRGEDAADAARAALARLIGAAVDDVALIPSVSAAAGLVAAQFGPASAGANVVIGEREYSSNHFPWRQLAGKGYEVRQVPFRGGGLDVADVRERIDAATVLVAFSGVQSATGFRADIAGISAAARRFGALVFVDGSQLVGALPVSEELQHVDVLVAPDHKFLLNAGRGMGYCYLSTAAQERFVPVGAGWRSGRVPMESFYGPAMDLSPTASRFDSSISWLAAVGNVESMSVFDELGVDAIHVRNRDLTATLRAALEEAGCVPADVPARHHSTIVSVPMGDREPAAVLAALADRDVVASARDGLLRLSIHFYNHEDDIAQLTDALADL